MCLVRLAWLGEQQGQSRPPRVVWCALWLSQVRYRSQQAESVGPIQYEVRTGPNGPPRPPTAPTCLSRLSSLNKLIHSLNPTMLLSPTISYFRTHHGTVSWLSGIVVSEKAVTAVRRSNPDTRFLYEYGTHRHDGVLRMSVDDRGTA